MTESFAELFEQSIASQPFKRGAILTGLVVDVNDDVVIVNAGLKSEAVIPAEQFRDEHGDIEVAIGDEVEVALDAVEDGFGETRLSRDKAKRARTWPKAEEAFARGHYEQHIEGRGTITVGDEVRAGPLVPRGQAARLQGDQARQVAQ